MQQFVTEAGTRNYLSWDYIPMDDAALTLNAAGSTSALCQSTCAADAKCQYFEWRVSGSESSVDPANEGCFQRTAASNIARVDLTGAAPATATNTILFEVRAGGNVSAPS